MQLGYPRSDLPRNGNENGSKLFPLSLTACSEYCLQQTLKWKQKQKQDEKQEEAVVLDGFPSAFNGPQFFSYWV